MLKPVVTGATKGRNGCVFAYGQTGSGKTHTVVGGDSFRERGLVPRAISQIFRYASKRQPAKVSVSATFAQVYDDVLYDLLDPRNSGENVDDWVKARVLEDNGSLKFDGLAEYEAASSDGREGYCGSAPNEGRRAGRRPTTSLLESLTPSSRCTSSMKKLARAKLHLVDLAGSERFSYRHEGRGVLRESEHQPQPPPFGARRAHVVRDVAGAVSAEACPLSEFGAHVDAPGLALGATVERP